MSHLLDLIQHIERQHHLDRDTVCAALEDALVSAARRQYPRGEITARVDRSEGTVEVCFQGCPLRADDVLLGTGSEIFATGANRYLSRAAAESVLRRYAHRQGDLVTGSVEIVLPDCASVRLADGAAATIAGKQLAGQPLVTGQAIEAVVERAARTESGGVVVILSRTRPELLTRYLEQAVPEIAAGLVQVVALARAAGYRAKVLLRSTRPDIDALACVAGPRGERLQGVVAKLGGERVDLIEHSPDPHEIAAAALEPAKVEEVLALPLAGKLVAIVPAGQEQLARGRRDQNVYLASQLAKVDIIVRSRQTHDMAIGTAIGELMHKLDLERETAQELAEAGVSEPGDLEYCDTEEIHLATGLNIKLAAQVMGRLVKWGANDNQTTGERT